MSRFSRRSKRPAQRSDGSGAERIRAAVAEALERTHEHGQLEVDLRDPHRRRVDSCPAQHRLPLDELRATGLAVPGAALAPGRPRARAGSAPEGPRARTALSRHARPPGAAPPPAPRASTEKPRRAPSARAVGRTRAPRPGTHAAARPASGRSCLPVRSRPRGRPNRVLRASAHDLTMTAQTSTMTGRIIGRRPVLS